MRKHNRAYIPQSSGRLTICMVLQHVSSFQRWISAGVKQLLICVGWGMAVASSRAFKLGPAKQPTMLPLIDLCNHSLSPNCKLETSADGTVRLIASDNIAAAEAIFINYGPLSNPSLLQDYGFIVEDNPHDAVDMQVSIEQIQVCCLLRREKTLHHSWLDRQQLVCGQAGRLVTAAI